MFDSVLVWFRRDLRDHDHTTLDEALRRANRVHCAFIFDRQILDALPSRTDRRVEFIRESLVELDAALRRRGGGLIVRHAGARREIPHLAKELGVDAVFCNRDYEPLAKTRDAHVAAALDEIGIGFESFKDQAIFDGAEVLTQAGKSYTVFTPYKNAWLKRLVEDDWRRGALVSSDLAKGIPSLSEIGFETTDMLQIGLVPGMTGACLRIDDFRDRLSHYAEWRDYPAAKGVSYLSVHLRFGTVSIRELVAMALDHGALRGDAGAACWLSELIWRDFYFMILDHFHTWSARPSSRNTTRFHGSGAKRQMHCSRPGARRARVIPWSMPQCVS